MHLSVPDLTVEEISRIVSAAGGDASKWASTVHEAGAFGHPQLVQAVIAGLRARSWPNDELERLKSFERSADVEAERLATRQRLVAAVPSEASTLLYRISILLSRFERPLALALGALDPIVNHPGAQLDLLIGPWVEQVGREQLRMSPLLQNAGYEVLAPEAQRLVHRTAAEHIVGGRSIDIDKVDAAFLHALQGKSEVTLLMLAYGAIRTHGDARRLVSDWSIALRLHRLDRLIYPDRLSISIMLRLAQFLLVAAQGRATPIVKCWQTLQAELNQEPDTTVRERFEYMMLALTLVDRSAAGILANWVDLILRFEQLTNSDPERLQVLAGMDRAIDGRPILNTLSMFFMLQAMGVRSVASLRAAFDRLDRLTAEQRALVLADISRVPSNFALVVNNAWLAEHKRGKVDGPACAEAYRLMAVQAQNWGYRDLALRSHIARGIMFDEYAGDPEAALEALEDAKKAVGDDPVLARARAKILYRRKDHEGALLLLRDAADKTALDDPIERTYMLREAGISAAEIGQWAEAQRWFSSARDAALSGRTPVIKVMVIGLKADAALAAFKAGDTNAALKGIDESLAELAGLDPMSSVAAGYCHRVVRHSALWLFGQGAGKDVSVEGQPAAMVPGMCSNPEPTDLKDRPLGSLDYAHYLLAVAEIALDASAGIDAGLRTRLRGRAIPAIEVMLRHERLVREIRRFDVDGFIAHLPAWVDSLVYMKANASDLQAHGPLNPAYGEIGPTTSQEPATIFAIEYALLALGTMAAISSHPTVLASLRSRATNGRIALPGRRIAEIMASGERPGDRLEDHVAAEIYRIATRTDLTTDDLFVACVRFVQSAAHSNFKSFLARPLAEWARTLWTGTIREQRFRLRLPFLTVPLIEQALASGDVGLTFAGKLLVTLEPAVNRPLDQSLRSFLLSL